MSSDFKVTLKIVLHTFKQYEIYTHRNGLGVSLERRTGSSRTLRRRGRTYSKHIKKTAFDAVVASATNLFVFAYE